MPKFITLHKAKDDFELQAILLILKQNDIPCYSKGEYIQNLFGIGTAGTGYNLITGPAEIQVPEQFFEEAQAILGNTIFSNTIEDETDIPEICPACSSPTDKKPICPDCGLVFVRKE